MTDTSASDDGCDSGTITLAPILREQVREAANFLHRHMDSTISVHAWAAAHDQPWMPAEQPHGYCLRRNGEIVGVYMLINSLRTVNGKTEHYSNLGSWCVLPEHRSQSFRLINQILRQRDLTFTDFSAAPHVARLQTRMGFVQLDSQRLLMPNIPWKPAVSFVRDHARIAEILLDDDRQIFLDHAPLRPVRHLVMRGDATTCHIIYRPQRVRRLPAVEVLHVSNSQFLHQHYRSLGSELLRRDRALITVFEERFLVGPPRGSVRRPGWHDKYYRSDRGLAAKQIDNLYSELMTLPFDS